MRTTARNAAGGKRGRRRGAPAHGVVSDQIHGFKNRRAGSAPGKLIEQIRLGLPVEELDVLQASLDVPMDKLALKLGISKATLHRRKAQGRLGSEESDRVLRFARLMGRAIAVFSDEGDAKQWLSSPQFGLGGEVPLDYAETEVGAREVEISWGGLSMEFIRDPNRMADGAGRFFTPWHKRHRRDQAQQHLRMDL